MDISKILVDKIDNYYSINKKSVEPHADDGAAVKNSEQHPSDKANSNAKAKDIEAILEKLNNVKLDEHERVSFSYHEKTHRIVIKIVNEDNEVVREIPAEDSLKLLEQIQEQMGLLVDRVG